MMEINPTYLIGGVIAIASVTTLAVKLTDRSDSKRAKIYKRIEKGENDAEKKFTLTKVCDERTKNMQADITEIKGKTDCIPAIKAGVDLLLKKNGLKK